VALEKVEKSSGPLIGSSIASIQKNTAPKVIIDALYLSEV
jgi:AP-5 complex subunit zeta-1